MTSRLPGPRWLPVAVFVLGLLLSWLAAALQRDSTARQADLEFEARVARLALALKHQFAPPSAVLQGLAAHFEALPEADAQAFSAFVRSFRLQETFPGVRGFSWIPRVPRDELVAYIDAVGRADHPGYRIHGPDEARHADLFPVRWIEPWPADPAALGYDIGSEPPHRAAIEAAARSGRATLSASSSPPFAAGRRQGLLLVLPVYAPGPPPADEAARRQALVGVLAAPIAVDELLGPVARQAAGDIAFVLRDVGVADARPVVYDPAASANDGGAGAAPRSRLPTAGPRHELRQTLRVGGHDFELQARSTPAFEASTRDGTAAGVFGAGLAFSLLLALLTQQQVVRRTSAESLAKRMTREVERLAMVAQRTSNGVVITDAARRITWVNEGFETITGYRPAEVLGRSPGVLMQFEGTDPGTVVRMKEALDAGLPFSGDLLNRGKFGRVYWVALEIQPLRDESGRLEAFMAILSDITGRKQAEEALRGSQAFQHNTGRIAGVGGWSYDLARGELTVTEQARAILEIDPEQPLAGSDILQFCAPEARRQLQQQIDQGMSGDLCWDLELPLVTATGRPIWVRLVAEGQYADSGAVCIVGAIQDVTARRGMEAEVQRNALLLRAAIDAVDEAFVLFGPDDRLVFCNDKYRALYTASADLLVPGARFEDIVRIGALRGQYRAALGRVEEWVAERMAAHRSGNTTLVQHLDDGRVVRVVERRMPDGHLVGFRMDITDLVRATEAAERANRAQKEFIATMSHELRTPLQSVIGFSELGVDLAADHPRFGPMFDDIHAGGRRMLTLVNQLLDMSKIDGTSSSLNRSRCELNRLAGEVVRELEPLAAQRRLRLQLTSMPDEVPLQADAFRLQQVLRNVVANALRFAPEGSAIEIDVGQDDDGALVRVRDHGPGIPEDELEAVFEPFVQSSRTRDGSGGTGLGLTICRKIMTAHGGSIVAGAAEGGGALFSIRLPREPGPARAPRTTPVERERDTAGVT